MYSHRIRFTPAIRWLFCLWCLGLIPKAIAGLSPHNVALVVNAADFKSMRVANEYQALRNIPARNVIYLDKVPSGHSISLEAFKSEILGPIIGTLKQRKLLPHIHVIAYSSGFPTNVNCEKEINANDFPQMHNASASITGLTYLYQLTLAGGNAIVQPHTNYYAQVSTSQRAHDPEWTENEKANYKRVIAYFAQRQSKGKPTEAQTISAKTTLKRLAAIHPNHVELQYNRACLQALTKDVKGALLSLEAAVAAGWTDHDRTMRDPDLASLHKSKIFKALIEKMKTTRLHVPSRGFASTYGWDATGKPVSITGKNGQRPPQYLLSTMLGSHMKHGISLDHTIAYLKGARSADGAHPTGTIYFTEHKDIRSKTRQWARSSAAAAVRNEGVAAEVIKDVFPDGKTDIAGAMLGFAQHDPQNNGSRIQFGAICDNLTSWGGALYNKSQTKMVEFLRMGAAGVSGTVSEPYALQFKFADAFLQVHYVRGCTLAEAYYQSVRSPYNLLIMGDPLCAPWIRRPSTNLATPIPRSASGSIRVKPLAASPIAHYELFIDDMRTAIIKPGFGYDLDTTKFADGWHQLDLIAVANTSIQTHAVISQSFYTDNYGLKLTIDRDSIQTFLGGSVDVSATCNGAEKIILTHNGRPLATAAGPKAKLSVPAALIGTGPSTVRIVAVSGKKAVQSAAIPVVIK